jgi:hypothetical protein
VNPFAVSRVWRVPYGEALQGGPVTSKLWFQNRLEIRMPWRLSRAMRLASSLAGMAAMASLCFAAGSAKAAPWSASALAAPASQITQVRIYRRGRPPIYPYYYNPGRPGGYSFYFGFVPYAKGNIENQAIQRNQYPQDIEWPPGLYGGPRPGWGPKATD